MDQFFGAISVHRRAAILRRTTPVSYAELLETTEANMKVLHGAGFQPGQGHLVLADVALGWRLVPVLLAAIRMQVTFVPFDSCHAPQLATTMRQELKPDLVLTNSDIDEHGAIRPGVSVDGLRSRPELHDVMLLLYSSGTTGKPKGVMLTHQNIWSNVASILRYFQLNERDRMLIVRPLTHASAITGELLAGLYAGCSMYVKPVDLSPAYTVSITSEYDISILCTTPTVCSYIASRAAKTSVETLRTLVLSGECLQPAQYEKIRTAFAGTRIWNAYGLTEASPRVSCRTDDGGGDCSDVGPALAGIEVKVVDDDGAEVAEGCRGELIVRGPNVMKGYWNEPQLTSDKIRDGWLHTSDLAALKDGSIHIYGRKDDCIIRSGVNLHPAELEQALTALPGIHEALVFAMPQGDHVKTQVHAWIVADPEVTPAFAMKSLINCGTDARLWPDRIEMKTELPRTGSGKLKRPKTTADES